MILAGIDEAGFGPLLGPLCVGACAVRLPDGDAMTSESPPDAWQLLRRAMSQSRDKTGRRLHVADSKKVYAGRAKAGAGELERTALTLTAAAGSQAETLEAFFEAVGVTFPGYAWYTQPPKETHPASISPTTLGISVNAVRHEADATGVELLRPTVRALFEGQYNELCNKTRNKAAALQTVVASLLYDLMEAHAASPGGLYVVLDRQGGRSHYGSFLRTMFEAWELTVLDESDGTSTYLLTRGEAKARLTFAEKGESLCLPTAAASCMAKYVRERAMERLNAYWQREVKGLKPTAGYWQDGLRFLEETAEARKRLDVPDAVFVRQR